MALIHSGFEIIPGAYLFSEVAARVKRFQQANPEREILRLGIGDVTRPLAPAIIQALHQAVDDMASAESFHGYGPDCGYDFLIDSIIENNYTAYGVRIQQDEILISDGSKSDCANIQELFSEDAVVAVTDPVYPVYVDSNAMAGRAGSFDGVWSNIVYLPCRAENGFMPPLPDRHVDLIYLCSPNNPTGSVMDKGELKKWVDYALENDSVILFDAAYRAYISSADLPRTIYEIPGADRCAIEFGSFSKNAGFTGTRCSWLVVPKALMGRKQDGSQVSLNELYRRRQSSKFNGTAYIIQRAAAAAYSPEGLKQTRAQVAGYMANAQLILETLEGMGMVCSGGTDSPYVWYKTPGGMDSWQYFDRLLNEVGIVGTPGAGFGPCGEGYFRLTAFGSPEDTKKAMDLIGKVL